MKRGLLKTLFALLLLLCAALQAAPASGEAVYKAHRSACHDQLTPRILTRDER